MAPFFQVFCRRSDGKLQISKGPSLKDTNALESNEPTTSQLDPKPNDQGVSDFYRTCEPGHGKEVDWRRKLGGMLVRELGEQELQDKNYILASFPENYRLYEHVRTRASNATGQSKTHAAGGNERQDSYLYGHPQGRKKRYRSPADFFPHLLWLSTDETGDPMNCSCRICTPEDLELEDDTASKSSNKLASTSKTGPVQKAAAQPIDPSQAARRTSQGQAPASNLPRMRNYEQKLDHQYNNFFYRPGEIVWFQREQAFGLGTIVGRGMRPPPNTSRPPEQRYTVQPLAHQYGFPKSVDLAQSQIRNWLAWSPPPCLNPDLNPSPANGNRQSTYEGVDWRAYMSNPKTSSVDAEVDSSILAAKMVETTYTLIDLVESKTSTGASTQVSERLYNGLYLGAERIWLGDCLRLRGKDNTPSTDIMVLQKLLERQHPEDSSRSAVLLIGDIYSHVTVPSNTLAPTSPMHPSNLFPTLPARLRSDLQARNQLAASSPNPTIRAQTHTLKLSQQQGHLTFSDVKGRWYESSLLMPILQPNEYANQKRNGELVDCGLWMNGHGDCNKGPANIPPFKPAWIRCKTRKEAYGKSVPKIFEIRFQEKEPEVTSYGAGRPTSSHSAQGQTQPQNQNHQRSPSQSTQSKPQPQQKQQSAQSLAQAAIQSQSQSQSQPQPQTYQQPHNPSQPQRQYPTQYPTQSQAQSHPQPQSQTQARSQPTHPNQYTVQTNHQQQQAREQHQQQRRQSNQQYQQQHFAHQQQQSLLQQSLAQGRAIYGQERGQGQDQGQGQGQGQVQGQGQGQGRQEQSEIQNQQGQHEQGQRQGQGEPQGQHHAREQSRQAESLPAALEGNFDDLMDFDGGGDVNMSRL